MDRRNAVFAAVGTLAIANRMASASVDEKQDGRLFSGVPSFTVERLSAELRKNGNQHRFLAHQMEFRCTCKPFKGALDEREIMYFEIEGLSIAPKARLFHLLPDLESQLKLGVRLDVHGLILEQNYGVWSIWVYSAATA